MSTGIIDKIPHKTDPSIYSIYTDYEKDHTKPYTTIIGCKVDNLSTIPTGMVGKTFAGGNYSKRTVKGNIREGLVFNEWAKIWNADLPRVFTADFEVYGEKAQDPENAEVDIFVAVE
jgi:predicted transcriptional regulator YdeE